MKIVVSMLLAHANQETHVMSTCCILQTTQLTDLSVCNLISCSRTCSFICMFVWMEYTAGLQVRDILLVEPIIIISAGPIV